jgi:iron complex outermembrane receptor protein
MIGRRACRDGRGPRHPRGWAGAALLAGPVVLLAASPAAPHAPPPPEESVLRLPPVTVLGATPVPALGTPLEKYPGNVQSVTAPDLEHQVDLSAGLHRSLGSVNINANQGNPWQNDLTYRGFLASPLTGSPIGLSVYLDGMRFNDGFGDTVNWDLVPAPAIAGIDVIPGSNPLFGLNTLGGALAVRTKRGFEFPGASLEGSGGSFGLWAVEAVYGGFHGPIDWFVAADALGEDGWRDESPTDLRRVFAKLGWRRDRTDLELSGILADNGLIGNGLAPESLLARDRSAVHTFPDETENRMQLVNLRGSHGLTERLLLSANAFYRHYARDTLNGRHLELWTRIENVTDADYGTAGALNFNAFASPIAVERFAAPGAPRSIRGGVRLRF